MVITIVIACVDLIVKPSFNPVISLNSEAFKINFSPSRKVLSAGPIIILIIIPFAIILSSLFLSESISFKKWILIFASFFGIVLIAFDPKISEEILATLLIFAMAFFYGLSQVFSRYLKELDVKFTNAFMGLIGFIILITISQLFEGNVVHQLANIDKNGWIAVLYAGAIISIFGHMMMFYLYKFYPVGCRAIWC